MLHPARLAVPFLLALVTLTSFTPSHAATLTRALRSSLYPYSIGYPTGWAHTTQHVGTIAADAFFAPHNPGTFADNVNVFAHADRRNPTQAQLLAANLQQLRVGLGVKPAVIGTVSVAGYPVHVFSYPMTMAFGARHLNLTVTQAVLSLHGRDWYFTLSDRPSRSAKFVPVFESMLATFVSR